MNCYVSKLDSVLTSIVRMKNSQCLGKGVTQKSWEKGYQMCHENLNSPEISENINFLKMKRFKDLYFELYIKKYLDVALLRNCHVYLNENVKWGRPLKTSVILEGSNCRHD